MEDSLEFIDKQWQLRTAVYNKLYDWFGTADLNEHPTLLAKLCGRSDHFHPRAAMTDHEIMVCQNLLGPHGYAYYRALLAQREMADGE